MDVPFWSLPDSQNLIYLINQPEGDNTKDIVSKAIFEKLGKRVSFVYARRVGRKKSDTNRHILIRLKNCDKDDLLSSAGNSPYVFENFTAEYKNEIEKVHTSFMKRTLNVSKYSSNKCMYGELARFPLSHNAWGLGIKYWLRLYNGTNNTLLNNFYRLNVEENHQWVQNIQYILTSNGFGDIWSNPQIVCGEFHKVLKMRLNDQFIQEWQGAISTSSRFVTRRALSIDYKLPVYITQIRNPDIRLNYTRLRADLNILSTSRASNKAVRNMPIMSKWTWDSNSFYPTVPFLSDRNMPFLWLCQERFSPSLYEKWSPKTSIYFRLALSTGINKSVL